MEVDEGRRIGSSSEETTRGSPLPPPRVRGRVRRERGTRASLLPPDPDDRMEFPALRPAIRGERKNLDDLSRRSPPPPLLPSQPTSALKQMVGGGRSEGITADDLEKRLRRFQQTVLGEIRSLLQVGRGRGGEHNAAATITAMPPSGKGPAARRRSPQKTAPVKTARRQQRLLAAGKAGDDTAGESRPATETRRDTVEQAGKATSETWSRVVGRREKRAARAAKPPPPPPTRSSAKATRVATAATTTARKRLRLPRTSAVSIICPKGEYAQVMAEVRAKVPLSAVGLTAKDVTTRRGATGSTIVEVGGPDSGPKADALASAIRLHFAGRGDDVRVDRPTKTADIRVKGLEASITAEEVAEAVAKKGGCSVQEVKAGEFRAAPRGTSSLWARMPLAAARKAVENGSIHVGWTRAKIELLDVRPLRCFKCLERGHTRAVCPNPVDRTGHCYRCAGVGHTARDCAAPPKCPLCTELGRRAGHTLGARECAPAKRRQERGRGDEGTATSIPRAARTAAPVGTADAATTAKSPRRGKPTATTPAAVTAEGEGIPPAEEGELLKPQRRRRRTTRPLEDDEEEGMEVEEEEGLLNSNQ